MLPLPSSPSERRRCRRRRRRRRRSSTLRSKGRIASYCHHRHRRSSSRPRCVGLDPSPDGWTLNSRQRALNSRQDVARGGEKQRSAPSRCPVGQSAGRNRTPKAFTVNSCSACRGSESPRRRRRPRQQPQRWGCRGGRRSCSAEARPAKEAPEHDDPRRGKSVGCVQEFHRRLHPLQCPPPLGSAAPNETKSAGQIRRFCVATCDNTTIGKHQIVRLAIGINNQMLYLQHSHRLLCTVLKRASPS